MILVLFGLFSYEKLRKKGGRHGNPGFVIEESYSPPKDSVGGVNKASSSCQSRKDDCGTDTPANQLSSPQVGCVNICKSSASLWAEALRCRKKTSTARKKGQPMTPSSANGKLCAPVYPLLLCKFR